jgi:hypothetical protein
MHEAGSGQSGGAVALAGQATARAPATTSNAMREVRAGLRLEGMEGFLSVAKSLAGHSPMRIGPADEPLVTYLGYGQPLGCK